MLHEAGINDPIPARHAVRRHPTSPVTRPEAVGASKTFIMRPDRKKPTALDLDLPRV
jgi:hypothetical protein